MGQLPVVVVAIRTGLDAFLNTGGLVLVEEPTVDRPAKQRKFDDTSVRVCFSRASQQSCCFRSAFVFSHDATNEHGGGGGWRLAAGKEARAMNAGGAAKGTGEHGNTVAGPACGCSRCGGQTCSSSCRRWWQDQTQVCSGGGIVVSRG